MNTKVEEALGDLRSEEGFLRIVHGRDTAEIHMDAVATLTAHIAQQDATIARMREALAQIAEFTGPGLTPVYNSVKKSNIARAALNRGEVK